MSLSNNYEIEVEVIFIVPILDAAIFSIQQVAADSDITIYENVSSAVLKFI